LLVQYIRRRPEEGTRKFKRSRQSKHNCTEPRERQWTFKKWSVGGHRPAWRGDNEKIGRVERREGGDRDQTINS
jgi:hypothetical protein